MRSLLIPLLLGVSSIAIAEDDHYYAGFEFGMTKAMDQGLDNDISGLSLEDHKNLGTIGGLYVGRAMGKFRIEGEYAIRKNRYHSLEVANAGGLDLDQGSNLAGGRIKSSAIMANAWYEFADISGWKAFIGAGIGMADIDVKRMRSGSTLIVDDSRWAVANQAMLQLVKPFKGGLELGVGFRHFRTYNRDFDTEARTSSYKAVNNELFARLSWRFGETSAPAAEPVRPTPVAQPAPKPAPTVTEPVVEEKKPEPKPAPLPGPFIVFFDFDKSDITPDAARIIRAAAKAFKENRDVRIVATGHADRAGSQSYNQRLSERRAEAVKAALLAEGVSASAIRTAAKGEDAPLVQTGDGVREPQNRRTEIVLSR
jgi:outer membrane protein OmpA-like peptidoglycan-associated protein